MKRSTALILIVAFIFMSIPVYADTQVVAPIADNVHIDGVAYAGGKISGVYDYVCDTPEGNSRYRWLVYDDKDGEYIALEDETDIELCVTEWLLQKYIVFEVTPVDESGAGGETVLSEPVLEQSVPETYFEESFEELDTDVSDGDGWYLTTAGGTVELNDGNLTIAGNGVAGSTVGAERRFLPIKGVFLVDLTFTLSQKQPTNLIYAYEGSASVFNITVDANHMYVWVGNNGFETAKQERLLTDYQAGVPYHMTVLVNTDTDRLALAVNDEWLIKDAYLRKDVTTGINKFLTVLASNVPGELSVSQYSITKYVKNPDLESVANDLQLLELDVEGGIDGDLILPLEGENGSTIRWESSNPDVISETGVVTRSTEGDVDVVLTAYLKKGNTPEISVSFDVKVLQFVLPPVSDRIKTSLDSLSFSDEAVKDDLVLPVNGVYDVVITWISSDEEIISSDGKVDRPSKDTYVTLTAVASVGEESDERNFKLLVKGTSSGSSGGGGGSGGSGGGGRKSSGKSVSSVQVPAVNPVAEEVKPAEPQVLYSDIEGFEWAEEAIMNLSVKGVVKGVGDKAFEPGRYIKREEFVHMLVNGFEISKDADVVGFTDVEKDSWYENSVLTAKSVGLVMGKGDNAFGTGELMTRQDAAVMLYRVLVMKNADMYGRQANEFKDSADVAEYAAEAVDMLWTNDIVKGSSDGCFYPENNMNRAEACKLLYEAVLLLQRR